ncbi:MAG: hypothetical protein OHK0013_19650 [Sandaracinaceae bacterium]
MRSSRRALAACSLALLATLAIISASPCPAAAQSAAELAESRSLFEQGLEAARSDRWEDARSFFARALAITERPSILLNLAAAQAELGEVVDSAASYRRFLEIATGRDARNRAEAQRALARVEARIAYLEIEIVGGRAGDVVTVDAATIEAARLDAPIPLDPGRHEVVVRRSGQQVASWSVQLDEGTRERISLRVVEQPVPVAVPTAALAPTREEEPAPSGGGDDALAIGLGVGIGAVVVGAVVLGAVLGTSQGSGVYTGNVGGGVIRF